jgi:A49-like RNA polymerase I associated factor
MIPASIPPKVNWSNDRYAICIYNPEKESVKIVPAPMVRMQRSIKALKARADKTTAETPSKVCCISEIVF